MFKYKKVYFDATRYHTAYLAPYSVSVPTLIQMFLCTCLPDDGSILAETCWR
jgi:hypothetical protein